MCIARVIYLSLYNLVKLEMLSLSNYCWNEVQFETEGVLWINITLNNILQMLTLLANVDVGEQVMSRKRQGLWCCRSIKTHMVEIAASIYNSYHGAHRALAFFFMSSTFVKISIKSRPDTGAPLVALSNHLGSDASVGKNWVPRQRVMHNFTWKKKYFAKSAKLVMQNLN